ncbi:MULTISPECIES: crossover junction endodeoxyribonuclease RuvC [Gulosibacter]|uniref:crossover junction endodeoxyribonuclease RuvC n=1 Tax=Gulosibacter TaxID=256818 RepID=UPI000F63F018|nr:MULTISPECIES: crossover junction endodeoxyribonuclease RuvC [Gulosibacter]
MAQRILGIDPGLTRCGAGIVDVGQARRVDLVHVEVIRTPTDAELQPRLGLIGVAVERLLDEYRPEAVSIERVFAEQRNLNTVMGVAQVTGIVIREAHRRGIDAELHTPSEVKAAVSGYGNADKAQVQRMVQRILRLDAPPKPADAADALALAICAAWQSPLARVRPEQRTHGSGLGQVKPVSGATPAQEAWLAAERSANSGRRRLR